MTQSESRPAWSASWAIAANCDAISVTPPGAKKRGIVMPNFIAFTPPEWSSRSSTGVDLGYDMGRDTICQQTLTTTKRLPEEQRWADVVLAQNATRRTAD